MENGFSPAGLRVLVVDDDPTWLKILEKMLKKCSYEVTTCCLAREALDLLRERKDGFDIVISDVNMPDMDGFKLLEHVGLEMDLPVIMMSVDGETSRVMKGVQHGACDYLLKPIRMKELRNIWQHVFRKKIHEVRDIESFESIEDIQFMRNGSDLSDDGLLLNGGDHLLPLKKRKDVDNKQEDKEFGESNVKKARVVWSIDLHQKFVKAVHQIGFDKVGPKKILDLMNVPWLTRENVASHLQKYRLYLSRLQKENDQRSSLCGIKNPDLLPKDPAGNIILQNTANITLHNELAKSNYGFPPNKPMIRNSDSEFRKDNLVGILSLPVTEAQKSFTADIINSPKVSSNSQSSSHSFKIESDPFDSLMQNLYSWNGKVAEIEFKQEHNPTVRGSFDSSLDQMNSYKLNPLNTQGYESKRNYSFNQNSTTSNLAQKSLNSENGSALPSLGKDFQFCLVQGDGNAMNFGLPNTPFSNYNQENVIAEAPLLYDSLRFDFDSTQNLVAEAGPIHMFDSFRFDFHLYDSSRFDFDHLYDSTEHPLIDHGLFIT